MNPAFTMNEEVQISQLVARKIAGLTSEGELCKWKEITKNDPEMEHALEIIINLWNVPGLRNKKEIEAAFRKVSFRLNERRYTGMNIKQPQKRSRLIKLLTFFSCECECRS